MAMDDNNQPEDVMIIPDDEEEDWPEPDPQNSAEANRYMDKINEIFYDLSDFLHNERCPLIRHHSLGATGAA